MKIGPGDMAGLVVCLVYVWGAVFGLGLIILVRLEENECYGSSEDR